MMERRLRRDPKRRWIGGVCAGIADFLGVPVFLVRLLTVPLLLSPLLPLAVIAYVIALIAIPLRRESAVVDPEAESFRRSVQAAPSATFGQVRHSMRELEHRLRRLEAYVTSPEFDFDENLRQRRR